MTKQQQSIKVLGADLSVLTVKEEEHISLTDIARYKNPTEPKDVIANWLRLRNTIDYLGLRESINNTNFKGVEFDAF